MCHWSSLNAFLRKSLKIKWGLTGQSGTTGDSVHTEWSKSSTWAQESCIKVNKWLYKILVITFRYSHSYCLGWIIHWLDSHCSTHIFWLRILSLCFPKHYFNEFGENVRAQHHTLLFFKYCGTISSLKKSRHLKLALGKR